MTQEEFLLLSPGDPVIFNRETTYSGSYTLGKTYYIREQPIKDHSLTTTFDDNMNDTNGWLYDYFDVKEFNVIKWIKELG